MRDLETIENITLPLPEFDFAGTVSAAPHVIVVGNQKGGVGKSTTAFHA